METLERDPRNPAPGKIRELRAAKGLTQAEAAKVVNASPRAWQDWEYGRRPMDFAIWHLFRAKLEQHTKDEFVKATDGRSWGHDPSRKLRSGGELILCGDEVNLRSVRGAKVSVKVLFDRTDGLIGGYLMGKVAGFPGQASEVTALDGFGINEPVEFLEEQVEHVELRNEAHYN